MDNNETWLLNPKGIQVAVVSTRVEELVGQGYRILKRSEILAYKVKTPIDARIVQGQWYYSGYGRVQELLDNNIVWNPESNNLIFIGHPQVIHKESGKKYILITAFEANHIPNEWIPLLDAYDLIMVPSKFCERIFKDAGTSTTVKTMVQGTDNFILSDAPPEPEFRFIHFNSFADHGRKGWDLVASVFNQLFPPSTNGVKLILKSREHDVTEDLKRIPKNRNIQLIIGNYDRFKMNSLLSNVHCMVFPSRGEGIGLPPIETMARGIPTIFTDAYGMTEYEQFGIKVDIQGFSPAIYDFPFDGLWVEPSFDKLREKMFSVYSHYFEHKKKAISEVKKLRESFGEVAMVSRFKELMQYVTN
jgi:hypothetical protein